MIRPARVEALVHAANDGMRPLAEESSASEVVSAVMTLTVRTVEMALELKETEPGMDLAPLRELIGGLYMKLADTTRRH